MSVNVMDYLSDMYPDTLTGTPGSEDSRGDWVPSGAPVSAPCIIEGRVKVTKLPTGEEVTSTLQCLLDGDYSFTTEGFRFDLPIRYSRLTQKALFVDSVSDDTGVKYQEVGFE